MEKLELKKLIIDFSSQQISIDGQEYKLDLKAFQTLKFLLDNKSRVVHSDELIEEIWQGRAVNNEVVIAAIGRIRKLFKSANINRTVIKTVHKVGYQFVLQLDKNLEQQVAFKSSLKPYLWIAALITAILVAFFLFRSDDNNQTAVNSVIQSQAQGEASSLRERIANKHTNIIFIRHGDKASENPEDPVLSELGVKRVKFWRQVLIHIKFDQVYTTNTKRNVQTAELMSDLPYELYSPLSFDVLEHLKNNQGKNMLIVGHSNTIPDLVNRLHGSIQYPPMSHDNYNMIIQVTIDEQGNVSSNQFNVPFNDH